jgi:hypothetical protein
MIGVHWFIDLDLDLDLSRYVGVTGLHWFIDLDRSRYVVGSRDLGSGVDVCNSARPRTRFGFGFGRRWRN